MEHPYLNTSKNHIDQGLKGLSNILLIAKVPNTTQNNKPYIINPKNPTKLQFTPFPNDLLLNIKEVKLIKSKDPIIYKKIIKNLKFQIN